MRGSKRGRARLGWRRFIGRSGVAGANPLQITISDADPAKTGASPKEQMEGDRSRRPNQMVSGEVGGQNPSLATVLFRVRDEIETLFCRGGQDPMVLATPQEVEVRSSDVHRL